MTRLDLEEFMGKRIVVFTQDVPCPIVVQPLSREDERRARCAERLISAMWWDRPWYVDYEEVE